MTEKQKQIYRLGQVYGYICEKHKHWSNIAHDTQAAAKPLLGVTIALMAALKAQALSLDDNYIVLRMSSIDEDFDNNSVISLDDQGIFTLGKMQIKKNAKMLIDQTGMTQKGIADKLGVTQLTVGRWYRSESPLPQKARYEIEDIILSK